METPGERSVRVFSEAVTAGDVDAAVEVCHPEIEFLSVLAVSGRRYLGHEGIREYFEDVASAWAEWRVEVHRIVPGPDCRVAIVMSMHVRGKESGATLSERTDHIWTTKDGLLLRNEPYRVPGDVLRDLGLEASPPEAPPPAARRR
jgi:ketosteroid isomerase-like protein